MEFVRHPDSPRFYGRKNEMERFDCGKLGEAELSAVVTYVRDQEMKELKLR
jgi:hypothetical protein